MQQNSGEQPIKNQVYSREEYAKASFWDDRYAEKGGFFDWYAEYPELKPVFAQYGITPSDRVLMVGCGNSKLSQQMWEAGYKDIVNIDISPSVIEQMKTKYPHMVWEVMDATNMSYPDGHFDVVLDKGTLDALISGKNFDICEAMLRDCMRVTNPEGQLIQITYGSPQGRRKIFEGALAFDEYDYYQCRAELNDMSTMINLMRSNLPGKNLKNIIKEQDAMMKTLKEFSMIKLMRRKRKNQKEFIIWNHHAQEKLEINTNHLQPVKTEENVVEKKVEEQKVQVKAEDKVEDKVQEKIEEKVEEKIQEKVQEKVEQKPNEQPKAVEEVPAKVEEQKPAKTEQPFTYAPKKQPYVYVYSIRRKFAQGFDDYMADFSDEQLLKKYLNNQTKQCRFEGNPEQQNFTISTHFDNFITVFRALQFLKLKGASASSLLLTSDPDKVLNNSLKVLLFRSYSSRKQVVLRKTNVDVTIKLTNKFGLEWAFKELSQLSRKLVSSTNLYPCPKTFALFHVLKNRRLGGITANQIMEKYWFPTYEVRSATPTEIVLQLSLPPVTEKKQSEVLQEIQALLKPATVSFDAVKRGYLSYFDLSIWSIVNMACLSYSGEKLDLVLQEFWSKDELNSHLTDSVFDPNGLYNELPNTLALPEPVTSQAITHLLALY